MKTIMLMGKSGSGKTTSLRKMNPNETVICQVEPKELPFRYCGFSEEDKNVIAVKSYGRVIKVLERCAETDIKYCIIDDMNYLLTDAFMRRATEKGYEKFTELASSFYDFITAIKSLEGNTIVILMVHEEMKDDGVTKMKTFGRMIDEKICIEGKVSIYIRSVQTDDGFKFQVLGEKTDVVKTPIEMFATKYIDNDLDVFLSTYQEYYNARPTKKKKK